MCQKLIKGFLFCKIVEYYWKSDLMYLLKCNVLMNVMYKNSHLGEYTKASISRSFEPVKVMVNDLSLTLRDITSAHIFTKWLLRQKGLKKHFDGCSNSF